MGGTEMSDDLVDPRANWKFASRRIDQLNDRIEALTARAEAAEAREKECYEGWNACRSLALETIARAEAAEAREARLRAACAPLGPAMYFMDDRASDEDVCIISAKTVKDIRAALKGEQK